MTLRAQRQIEQINRMGEAELRTALKYFVGFASDALDAALQHAVAPAPTTSHNYGFTER